MFIIFYGPEGSGKSTQAKLLAKKLKLTYLGSGDLVRKYSQEDKGILGDVCREALHLGHYVADSEMFVLWKHRLKEKDLGHGFIIDGFPRNQSQVRFLDEKLEKHKQMVDLVFYLKTSEKTSIQRLLKRGRRMENGELHDSPQRIRERLRRYKLEEKAVLSFYQKRGILKEIDGEASIPAIHKNILQKIKNCQA